MSDNCQPRLTPGVTSKILWHFTGGPRREDIKKFYEMKLRELLPDAPDENVILPESVWEAHYRRLFHEELKNPEPKPEKNAFQALVNILQENLLRVDKDSLSFMYEMYNDDGKRTLIIQEMEQERFCSFCEIPIEHLQYHSARYGKFAVGFLRKNLLGRRVRPVHYVLSHDDFILPRFYEIYERLSSLRADEYLTEKHKIKIEEVLDRVYTIATFAKSFDHLFEFDTVYCEREWRAVIPEREGNGFRFKDKDVCFILSPKDWVQRVRDEIPEKYRQKPIVPFEDLVEH